MPASACPAMPTPADTLWVPLRLQLRWQWHAAGPGVSLGTVDRMELQAPAEPQAAMHKAIKWLVEERERLQVGARGAAAADHRCARRRTASEGRTVGER